MIAKRPLHKPLGGLWEFPGGKIEPDESPLDALRRELSEELHIHVAAHAVPRQPFYEIEYAYQPSQHIRLMVYKITDFSGEPIGAEGQQIQWVLQQHLIDYEFPAANQKIIEQLALNKST